MTDDDLDPSGDTEPPSADGEPSSQLDAALDAFKGSGSDADSSGVSESRRPGMTWSPVTETERDRRDVPVERSSFAFDLGGALARLTGGESETDETTESAEPVEPVERSSFTFDLGDAMARLAAEESGTDETVEHADQPVEAVAAPPAAPDVADTFDEIEATPPFGLPAAADTPTVDGPPADTAAVEPPRFDPGMLTPTLPASIPSAPPPLVTSVASGPSTVELNAVRAAQQRAGKNQRQGKLLGRSFLAFVLLGAAIAGTLVFGRSYLFPDEWGRELTPIVDEIQLARRVEFDHTVGLVERPADEYAVEVTDHLLGEGWADRVPEWRALGLAGGGGAVADVRLRVATLLPAFYDATADQVVASGGVGSAARAPAVRLALETALGVQLDGRVPTDLPLGLTGFEDPAALARWAFDGAAAGLVGTRSDPLTDLTGLPLPVVHRFRFADEAGALLIAGRPEARVGDPLTVTWASPATTLAPSAGLLVDDRVVAEPVALGPDAWTLVWGTRMSSVTTGRMADALVADSYTVFERGGSTCFAAVYGTRSPTAASELAASLDTWVGLAPQGAEAEVAQSDSGTVQLTACDPGPDAAVAPGLAAVDLVIDRQIDRVG
jgi:hypothetical protein